MEPHRGGGRRWAGEVSSTSSMDASDLLPVSAERWSSLRFFVAGGEDMVVAAGAGGAWRIKGLLVVDIGHRLKQGVLHIYAHVSCLDG